MTRQKKKTIQTRAGRSGTKRPTGSTAASNEKAAAATRVDPRAYPDHMTVGDIRRAIEGLPNDAPVFYERIEDAYFEKHGWATAYKAGGLLHGDSNYVRAWSDVKYRDEPNALFLTAHY